MSKTLETLSKNYFSFLNVKSIGSILVVVVIACVVGYFVMLQKNKKKNSNVTNVTNELSGVPTNFKDSPEVVYEKFSNINDSNGSESNGVSASDNSNEVFKEVEQSTNDTTNDTTNDFDTGCFPKNQLDPNELLPQNRELMGNNFLKADQRIGINTVGQSLRNANLQLRSEPPNPQKMVCPWMQSTISPDLMRRPLEISESC